MSRLLLGTLTFGLQTDEATSVAILDAAVSSGVNISDTADVYPLDTAGGMYQDRYWNERCFATVAQLQALAAEAGLPLATLAAASVMLDPALKAKLDALTADYRKGDALR